MERNGMSPIGGVEKRAVEGPKVVIIILKSLSYLESSYFAMSHSEAPVIKVSAVFLSSKM
jgi:hypothetical protein